MDLVVYCLWLLVMALPVYQGKVFDDCRFLGNFYKRHPNIFALNSNQRSLTVRALYPIANQSSSSANQSLSMGIMYRFANTYLVPVPLLFECAQGNEIYALNDCQLSVVDTRGDLSARTTSESTRTTTVPLHYTEDAPFPLLGAYFRESAVSLRNCRLFANDTIYLSDTFQLRIEFEQTIGSPCLGQCSHPRLYQCSSMSNTCQCRSSETGIEKLGPLCIDTELGSNCTHAPERCRRVCHPQQQKSTGRLDPDCRCPLGTRRVLSENFYRCELPTVPECDQHMPNLTCPPNSICQENRCMSLISIPMPVNASILPLPFILLALLVGALLIIIGLVAGLLRMRSVKCVKFIHTSQIMSTASTHSGNSSPATITRLSAVHSSSSPCSTLSSSSKSVQLPSTTKSSEKYRKIDLFE